MKVMRTVFITSFNILRETSLILVEWLLLLLSRVHYLSKETPLLAYLLKKKKSCLERNPPLRKPERLPQEKLPRMQKFQISNQLEKMSLSLNPSMNLTLDRRPILLLNLNLNLKLKMRLVTS